MTLIEYVNFNFKAKTRKIIEQANEIISEYDFPLTLRQLYYQFVSRGLLPNKQTEYKNLGSVINDGRLAGMIDWDSIEDLTRELRVNSHWTNPHQIVDAAVRSYQLDMWKDQPNRVECWVEKDALRQVIARTCSPQDVPYFSCRGYASQSEIWGAAQRFERYIDGTEGGDKHKNSDGQDVHIIHLGDHDPSGVDMTRDIRDRLEVFLGPDKAERVTVHRIALNMDQVKHYKPPPNPAKLTDSRAKSYVAKFGTSSWELDALEPKALDALIVAKIKELKNARIWNETYDRQEKDRARLKKAAAQLKKDSE